MEHVLAWPAVGTPSQEGWSARSLASCHPQGWLQSWHGAVPLAWLWHGCAVAGRLGRGSLWHSPCALLSLPGHTVKQPLSLSLSRCLGHVNLNVVTYLMQNVPWSLRCYVSRYVSVFLFYLLRLVSSLHFNPAVEAARTPPHLILAHCPPSSSARHSHSRSHSHSRLALLLYARLVGAKDECQPVREGPRAGFSLGGGRRTTVGSDRGCRAARSARDGPQPASPGGEAQHTQHRWFPLHVRCRGDFEFILPAFPAVHHTRPRSTFV